MIISFIEIKIAFVIDFYQDIGFFIISQVSLVFMHRICNYNTYFGAYCRVVLYPLRRTLADTSKRISWIW